MAITRLTTADDLLTMELPPGRYDLIDGELYQMPPAGDGHGRLSIRIALPIAAFVDKHRLGEIWAAETGFVVARDPDVVLAPDFAFIRADRLDPNRDRSRFLALVPDLAIEVISPSDYPKLVNQKVEKYLAAGIPLLLLVYPDQQRVRVLGAGREPVDLVEGDAFDGGDVLPDFSLPIADIFR